MSPTQQLRAVPRRQLLQIQQQHRATNLYFDSSSSISTSVTAATMPMFMNPFHKHDVHEFEGVYEPFEAARRHPSVVAANEEKLGTKDGLPDVESDSKEGETPPAYSSQTLEALRAEIDSDIAASGHDSIYDRRF